MLERIREGSSGVTAKVILGLVIATFIFAGVGSYTNNIDTSVATVNGQQISQQKFEQAYQNQRARMEQQYGEMFAQLAGNDMYMQNLRSNVLEQLINELLLDQHANELNIRVSDAQIKDTILTMPEFQIDGVFDNNRYLMVINQAGFYQASAFRDYLRIDMARRQLTASVMASEFSLPYQQELAVKLRNQSRDINYATIDAKQFASKVEVSEAEINEYYLANQARFATTEQVKVEYVQLSLEQIKADVVIGEDAVQSYYDNNLSAYSTIERRRASHILIEFNEDQAAAEQTANEILAKVKAGEDFIALAKQHSTDTFSGENGGDLGWLEPGSMDPAFDAAVFALTLGDNVSELVQSEFGFHIIKLTGLEEVQTKAFTEVQAEILAKLQQDQALENFYDLQGQLGEVAFESPDSLDDSAAVLNVEIQQSPWLSRGSNVAPFTNKVVEVAFSDDVLLDTMNSEVIEVEIDSLAMVVRVLEHKPAATKPLADVSDEVKALLVNTKANAAAQAAADSLLTKLVAAEDFSADLTELNTEFVIASNLTRTDSSVDSGIVKQAFLLAHPVAQQVTAASTVLSNGDYAVVQLTKVSEGVAGEADAQLEQQQVSALSNATFEGYISDLKEKAEIIRNLPANSQL